MNSNSSCLRPDWSLSITQLLESHAKTRPEATAVLARSEQLTYRELNENVDALAARLTALGVCENVVVGVCLKRGLLLPVALLATLKAGGTYLPLDPRLPRTRIDYMLSKTSPQVLVTESCVLEVLPVYPAHTIVLDRPGMADDVALPLRTDVPPIRLVGEQLAYVIFTSGSTGQPKGVAVTVRGLSNILSDMRDRLSLSTTDRWLAVTSVSFDIAALELFLPLVVGAQVIIAPESATMDPYRLKELMEMVQPTVMQATPSTWRLLLKGEWPSVKPFCVLCGGEVLDCSLAGALFPYASQLWNLYGPTETTIWSTALRVCEPVQDISIGTPISNTYIYLCNDQGKPVAAGEIGEICIGGAGVAAGYVGEEALTNARFVLDQHQNEPEARMYRTGDLGRWLPDGHLEFLGRKDNQVKVRGFRIELGEIEGTLKEHPAVADAAVCIGTDDSGLDVLSAFVVATPAGRVTTEILRQYTAQRLPTHMVPYRFVTLDALPRTLNGKIDRVTLSRLEVSQANGDPLTSPGELVFDVATIWRVVFGLTEVDPDVTFLELGGDSMLGMLFLTKVSSAYDVDLPFEALLEPDATLRQLTQRIAEQKLGSDSGATTRKFEDVRTDI